jgi:aspartate racemase
MATVGLVGGLGPESTIDYYKRIIDVWKTVDPTTSPSIVIDSLDPQRALRLVNADRQAFFEYLLTSVRRLLGAGVDFIAITANTPHLVFDELAGESPVPILSIVEVCAAAAQKRGLKRLVLLGTRFTMQAEFYPEVFARYGLVVVRPSEADMTWVHGRYVSELLEGQFLDETRNQFGTLIARLKDEHGVDGVILGGTELPLLLTAPEVAGLPLLDTIALHVDAIVEQLASTARPSQR